MKHRQDADISGTNRKSINMQLNKKVQDGTDLISRRVLLKRAGTLGFLAAMQQLLPACAMIPRMPVTPAGTHPSTLNGELIDLVISERSFVLDGKTGTAVTINGTIPGPLIGTRCEWIRRTLPM
jgi:hypothetical protein